ncbi:ice-binding family protein [Pedobacter cryoconitis]|uniref:Uncharacterized protein n=1 Tax=Pedobacter cryoconitis TaxID=188932 RepID=A0A7X0J5L4_9SPHI|nr:ice-binding family protein [Pedobacter cryoconitis]MBB6501084.1 hypothetical protein [Pedobacter cryoconitis]
MQKNTRRTFIPSSILSDSLLIVFLIVSMSFRLSAQTISNSILTPLPNSAGTTGWTDNNVDGLILAESDSGSAGTNLTSITGANLTHTVTAPTMGTLVNFVLYTSSGAVGNTGTSNITGNLGTNVGAITGLGTSTVIGSLHTADAATLQCSIDLSAAYVQLNATIPTAIHGAVLGNGETLQKGAYLILAAGSAAGTLTLDAQGDPNAVFIFLIGGAFTTGASTTVSLINGASACNVFWKAEGAIAMAALTTMQGTLIANNGAISMGAGGTLQGRMFSTLGAATVNAITATLPGCACTPLAPIVTSPLTYCQNATAAQLTATGTNLLWGTGSSTAPIPATTVIGSSNYVVTQTVSGCLSPPATITVNITAGPSAVITYINSPYRTDLANASVTLTGTTGGTYSSTTGLSLNTASGLVTVLTSTLGTYTVTYTIAAATGCGQYQTTTSITIVAPPSVNLGTAANFVLFTSSGAVGNTGVSNITGDIGTNVGAITGFGISTVVGTMHTADAATLQGAADLLSAYTQLNAISPTSIHGAVLGNGETLYPGIYGLAAAASVAAVLTLDAQGDPNALFIFKIGGAFTTGASTTVNLINGASSCNVYWKVEGAIAMAASTTMKGTLIANNGAAAMAAGGILDGRLFSTLGAIAIDGVTASKPVCSSGSSWTGAISTTWNLAGNWLNGIIPTSTTNTTIPSGVPYFPLLNTGTGSVNNITIQNSASLTVANATLQIAGTIINSGTFDLSAGTLIMNGAIAQVIPAAAFAGNQIQNLTVNNTAGVTLAGALNLSAILLATSGQFNTSGYLTLISTAAQTALIDGSGAGSVTGNVTMQRYLTAGYGYKYFSSPFQAATVSNFSSTVDLNATFPNFYNYIENKATAGFTTYTTTTNLLNPLQGYAADFGSSTAQKMVSMTGVVSNGSLSSTLYNNNQPYTQGFNLMGNPYPSPIDWDASGGWTRTNIDNAVYYFDSGSTSQYTGTYSTYINGVSSDGVAGHIIASMQGFFVHVSNGTYPVTGTFAINNTARVNNLSPVFHKSTASMSTMQRILVRLSANFSDNSSSSDPIVVYFDNRATPVFDKEFDAIKLMNIDELLPSLYSLAADSRKLVINALPEVDTLTVIPLGVQTDKDGMVTFNLRDLEQWPSNLHLYLTDAEKGTDQDLQQNPIYTASIKKGANENRFSLRCVPLNTNGPTDNKDDIYTIYGSGGILFVKIKLVHEQKGTLMISNTIGQVISSRAIGGNGDYELDGIAANVLYIVSFRTATGIHSQKILMTGK